MLEIISILIQFLIFLILFSFPLKPSFLNNHIKINDYNFSLVDAHCLNIILFLFFCIFISFLNIDQRIVFKIYISLALIFLILNKKEIKFHLRNFDKVYFLFFVIITCSIFIFISQNLKLEWDGHHWLAKVLVFYNDLKIQELKNVSIHPEYPHLGSYVWSFFWKNALIDFEYMGRFFQVYFYSISLIVILQLLKIKDALLKSLFLFLLIVLTFEPYLFAGYQEYLIFSTLIFSVYLIEKLNFDKNNFKILSLIILILYLNCWFKDEGIIYFIVFGSLLILFSKIKPNYKLILLFLIVILLYMQFVLQKYLIGIYDFPQTTSISRVLSDIFDFKILIFKITKIISHIIIAFIKYPLWLIVMISLLFCWLLKINKSKNFQYFSLCLFLNLAFIISIFFTFKSFDFMLRVSLDRLLFQTSGFYITFLIYIFNKFKFFNKMKIN